MSEKPGFLRAISLWNPHATLMVLGEKQNETRPKTTNVRGRVFIHSSLNRAWEHKAYHEVEFFEALLRHKIAPSELKYGYILGSVEIIGSQSTESLEILTPKEREFGNYDPGRGVWFTIKPQMLEKPIPFNGQQGFFWVPACCFCKQVPVAQVGQSCEPCHFDRMS